MRKSTLSYLFLGSFLATIFCLQWWQTSSYHIHLWVSLWWLATITAFGITQLVTRQYALSSCALLLGVTAALLTVMRTTHEASSLTLNSYNNDQVVITGQIVAEPDRRPMQTKYTVAVEQITTSSGTIIYPVVGRVLVNDQRMYPEYSYGDTIDVRGFVEAPGAIESFQYDRYLSRYGIYSVIYRGSLSRAPATNHIPVWKQQVLSKLYNSKATFESQINRLYAEPHASFMAGLLTGSRKGIPDHVMESFNITGLTHIIAISGYNITIIISIITALLFWLPLKWRFVPAVTAIIVFTIFVGASAAVVRASIMGILGLIALQVGRTSTVRLTVLWTLFIMLAWNPKLLWYDAGFQLSFLAVIGLIECAPWLERLAQKIPSTLGVREALQMTLAAQIAAVPLIIWLFGRLSLVAPIANVLVAPALPLAMFFGFCGTILSFIWFPLGQLVAYLGFGCLEWILLAAKVCASLPYASVDMPAVSTMFITVYYLMVLPFIHTQLTFTRQPWDHFFGNGLAVLERKGIRKYFGPRF